MRVAVCIKQVPDTEAHLKVAADGRWIDEEELPFVINESDEYALEEGLRIAEASGGEVVVFSLGPARVQEALRKALALGATRAVHLQDDAFAGGDALATGRALAAALGRATGASTSCSPARSPTTSATARPARSSPATSAGRTPGW